MDSEACRLCCENKATIHIFEKDISGVELCEKIIYCCKNVHVQRDDGLPTLVCHNCRQQVSGYYQFVLKCEASDKKLRSQAVAQVPQCLLNFELDLKREFNIACDDDQQIKDELPFEEDQLTEIKEELPDGNISVENLEEYKQEHIDLKQDKIVNEDPNTNHKTRKKKTYKKNKFKDFTFTCSVCGRSCVNQSTLAVHMRTHTNERPYRCSSCDKSYKDSGTLKRHALRNHFKEKRQRNFICECCGKSFYSKSDVVIHKRTHTGETPYACPICSVRFTQISAMLRHKRRHTGEKSYSCQECSKSFCTKEELKNHLPVHTSVKNFSCPLCNIPFKYQNNLKKHIKTHSEKNKYICNYCGRICTTKGNLKVHIDRQHSEKSGHCNICSKHVSNIEVHMWRHTGERPLKCELCTSSFYELKALAHHINFKHKKTDKYKCEVEGCMKSFPSRPMLDFHTAKLHGTQIPFPCDRCSRGFYRKNDLARHKIGTHKEKLK